MSAGRGANPDVHVRLFGLDVLSFSTAGLPGSADSVHTSRPVRLRSLLHSLIFFFLPSTSMSSCWKLINSAAIGGFYLM